MQGIIHQIRPGFLSPFYSNYVKEVFHHSQKIVFSQNIYPIESWKYEVK